MRIIIVNASSFLQIKGVSGASGGDGRSGRGAAGWKGRATSILALHISRLRRRGAM